MRLPALLEARRPPVTQNGLPFLQAGELKQSIGFFRELFADAFAYLASTPTYFGGPMSYGCGRPTTRAARAQAQEDRAPLREGGRLRDPLLEPRGSRRGLRAPPVRARAGRLKPRELRQAAHERPAIGIERGAHVVRARDELGRHVPRVPRHGRKVGAGAIAAIGFGRVRGANDDHGGRGVAPRRKLGGVAAGGARLQRIDWRRLGQQRWM